MGVSFGGGATFDIKDDLNLGLDLGFSVATTDTTSQSWTEDCSSSGTDAVPCVCSLQYMIFQAIAHGTVTKKKSKRAMWLRSLT